MGHRLTKTSSERTVKGRYTGGVPQSLFRGLEPTAGLPEGLRYNGSPPKSRVAGGDLPGTGHRLNSGPNGASMGRPSANPMAIPEPRRGPCGFSFLDWPASYYPYARSRLTGGIPPPAAAGSVSRISYHPILQIKLSSSMKFVKAATSIPTKNSVSRNPRGPFPVPTTPANSKMKVQNGHDHMTIIYLHRQDRY